MILVSLGTQDREFKRLLEAIEKQIILGNIKEKVIVQAGVTNFQSEYMEIFDLIPSQEFLKLLQECSLLICHGGVGTIIDGLKYQKKIIAAARLSKYQEHQNDHQRQIIREFTKKKLILELDDFDNLDQKLQEVKNFVPGKYESNTQNFSKQLDQCILESCQNHRGDFCRKFIQYAFYGIFALFLEGIVFWMFQKAGLNSFQYVVVSSFYLIMYRLLMHRIFFSTVSYSLKSEGIFYSILVLSCLFVFFVPIYGLGYLLLFDLIRLVIVYFLNLFFHVLDVELF